MQSAGELEEPGNNMFMLRETRLYNLIMSNANFLTATAAGEPAGDPNAVARHKSATMQDGVEERKRGDK